jgi:tRNA(adenine34) deaminase
MSWMLQALQQAHTAFDLDEIPVGAVIVGPEQEILAQAHNEVEQRKNPTAHAELLAIQQACQKLGSKFLQGYSLYVTLEPCAMCAQAISLARVSRLYFGAYDRKSGGVEHGPCVYTHPTCHFKPEVYGGIMERECQELLSRFFAYKRAH